MPTVALAHQQATLISEQTGLRVKRIVGADGVDYWKREEWTAQLDECDVLVTVGAVWLMVLQNAYWSLDRCSVIVFDEAHRAVKKDPYAQMCVRGGGPSQRGEADPVW